MTPKTKPKREVTKIFIHCSASDDRSLFGQKLVDTITEWHKARDFDTIGYHYVIDKNGLLLIGRDIERKPAANGDGYNSGTIAICVHGLADFSLASLMMLKEWCEHIDGLYSGMVSFHGHREVNPHKTCPVFDYKKLLTLNDSGEMERNRNGNQSMV